MPENNQPTDGFNNHEVVKVDQLPQAAEIKLDNQTADSNRPAEVKPTALASEPPIAGAKDSGPEDKTADVYSMPKEFQHHNRVAGNNSSLWGIIIVLFSFIFLVVIGAGFYLYIFNPGLLSSWTGQLFGAPATPVLPAMTVATTTPAAPAEVSETPATSTATTTAATALPAETPTMVYTNFLQGLAAINTFEDYYTLVSKYGSSSKLTAVEGRRLAVEATPESDQAAVKAIKEASPQLTGQENINEQINNDQATLTITSSKTDASGTIQLSLENGVWKVGTENWSLPQTPATPVYTLGADRDGDGLTDAEDDLLGISKTSSDFDKDGYSDLVEVLNLYDPAGPGKLIDNPHIKSYLADDQSFYFIYPATWQRVSNNGSPIFMGPNNHFFQLVIVANDQKETLDNYVKRILNLTQIKDSNRRTSDTWNGIITDDGLTIYLTGLKNQSKIYVLHYNPDDGTVLEYPNIFKAMIKSFTIKK
jgi:cell division septation protein DedD